MHPALNLISIIAFFDSISLKIQISIVGQADANGLLFKICSGSGARQKLGLFLGQCCSLYLLVLFSLLRVKRSNRELSVEALDCELTAIFP